MIRLDATVVVTLTVVVVSAAVASNTGNKATSIECEPGYVRGLFGECVKKPILPRRKECPLPEIRFGMYEVKAEGRVVYFWCEDGWTRAPDTSYAMCKVGKWDRELPRCVRPGCVDISHHEQANNVRSVQELNGAIRRYYCTGDPDATMEMVGDSVLSCDGAYWNATVPTCHKVSTTTTSTTTRRTGQTPRKTRLAKHENLMVNDGDTSSARTASQPDFVLTLVLVMSYAVTLPWMKTSAISAS